MAEQWFYQSGQSFVGPLSSAELKYLMTSGRIDRKCPVRRSPQDPCQPAEVALGLAKPASAAPPTPILRATPLHPAIVEQPVDLLALLPVDLPREPPPATVNSRLIILGSAVAITVMITVVLLLRSTSSDTAPVEEIATTTVTSEPETPREVKPPRRETHPVVRSGSDSTSDEKRGAKPPAGAGDGATAAGGTPPPSTEPGDSSGDVHIAFKGETVSLPSPPPPAPPTDTPDPNQPGFNADHSSTSGSGDGSARGEEGGAAFFGIPTPYTSVAYVVDCSSSMKGPPFDHARDELIRSIGELEQGQKFYVVFFNNRAFPQFFPAAEQRMIPVSNDSRKRIGRWIRSGSAGGSTDPTEALTHALARNPDAMFFLTDGDFNPDIVDMLARANVRRIPIHTIAFLNNVGEPLLKKISEQSGGSYRYVSQ
jgi:hypothetical protein